MGRRLVDGREEGRDGHCNGLDASVSQRGGFRTGTK